VLSRLLLRLVWASDSGSDADAGRVMFDVCASEVSVVDVDVDDVEVAVVVVV